MNVIDAAHATVHEYPGRSESLAPRIGLQPAILRHKVNPTYDRNHLSLDESVRLQEATGDHRILHAMACELGYVLIPVDIEDEPTSIAVATRVVLDMVRAQGDLSHEFSEAIADNILSPNERIGLSRLAHELMQCAARFCRMLGSRS